jgi:hypothetical protein
MGNVDEKQCVLLQDVVKNVPNVFQPPMDRC